MDSQNTNQKLAVITGGASGIGLSCSKRFAKEGYAVLIIDANKEAGEQELKSLKSDGYNADFAYCDITKHEQVAAIFQGLADQSKCAQVLVNCAGISPALNALHEYPVEEWHRAIDINLHGTFYACREFLDLAMKNNASDGSIINVA
jgi:NAD(P)-dependent dehydrogenase (short-subunit alcohol dehydrogenase family)